MGKKEEIIEAYEDFAVEICFLPPEYDSAILGSVYSFAGPYVAYSMAGIIEASKRCGMTEEEALEDYHHNKAGGYFEGTPVYIEDF
jgi:hypothetical protein